MPTDDRSLLDVIENEFRWRLADDPCPSCGRGADAENVASTALTQGLIGLQRLEIARTKVEEVAKEESEVSPFALLATAQKLPPGHATRDAIIQRIEGEILALQSAVGKLKAE